jgi:hypothetical protein
MEKPTRQEVEDLIKYCSDKWRTVPRASSWTEVMRIIEYLKLEKEYQGSLKCLILAGSIACDESKVKVLRNQIRWAGNHSLSVLIYKVGLNIVSTKRDKIFYELKDFLMNLPEKEWCHQ